MNFFTRELKKILIKFKDFLGIIITIYVFILIGWVIVEYVTNGVDMDGQEFTSEYTSFVLIILLWILWVGESLVVISQRGLLLKCMMWLAYWHLVWLIMSGGIL